MPVDPFFEPLRHQPIRLMIVGAQKAGTTSLKEYVGEHPQLATHIHKEFSYFYDDAEFGMGYPRALQKYFPTAASSSLLVAKHAGLYMSEIALRRLKAQSPDCQLVLLLRNPTERTYSAYLMEHNYGHLNESFEHLRDVANAADPADWRFNLLIGMSLYHKHLELIYRYFPKEQVTLVRYETLHTAPLQVCRKLYTLLGVDPNFEPDTSVRHNVTRKTRSHKFGKFITNLLRNNNKVKKIARVFLPGQSDYKVGELMRQVNLTNEKHSPISAEMAAFFRAYYTQPNIELSTLTGIDFTDWNQPATH